MELSLPEACHGHDYRPEILFAAINPLTPKFSQKTLFLAAKLTFWYYGLEFTSTLLKKHFFTLKQHFDKDSV